MKTANVIHAGYSVFLSENLNKIGHSRHCSEEQSTLMKTLIEMQKTIGCSAKMISHALKWQPKPERRGRKQKI